MESVIETYVPEYVQFASDVLASLSEFVVGGVLAAFMVWAVAFVVQWLFDVLNEWTGNDGEEG